MIDRWVLDCIAHDLFSGRPNMVSLPHDKVKLPENGHLESARWNPPQGDVAYFEVPRDRLTAKQRSEFSKEMRSLACLCLKKYIEVAGDSPATLSEQIQRAMDETKWCLETEFNRERKV